MIYTTKPACLFASALTLLAICETRGSVEIAPLSGSVVRIGNLTLTVPEPEQANKPQEALPVRKRSRGKAAEETTVTVRAESDADASSVFVLSGRPAYQSGGVDAGNFSAGESQPHEFTLSGEVGIVSGYGGSAG